MSSFDGILLVDKPVDITSAGAVAVVKRRLRRPGESRRSAPKVGHLGTLDPFASGLLPLCVGEGTKIAPYLNTSDKGYTGIVRLGIRTDTLDATGEVLEQRPPPDTAAIDLEELADAFRGTLEQIPPAFSAIKKDGVRMYELARRGEAPELEPRSVTIHRLAIEAAGSDTLAIAVDCSKGTYIRSLARDIGDRLGCGAVLAELRRTRFGSFTLDGAVPLAEIEAAGGCERIAAALLQPASALPELRTLTVGTDVATRLRSGQQSALSSLAGPEAGAAAEEERAKVVTDDGVLAAIVAERAGRWRLERVFHAQPPDAAS